MENERPAAGPAPMPLPLERLDGPHLGGFLELCFDDPTLLKLCRELKIYSPGYRLESMPPQDIARLIADEALEAKDVRPLLEERIRERLLGPPEADKPPPPFPLETQPLTKDGALDVAELVGSEPLGALAILAWRLLSDPDEELRKAAAEVIDVGLDVLDKSAQTPRKGAKKEKAPGQREAEKALERADKAEKERDAAKAQLAAARADGAQRDERLAAARGELRVAQEDVARGRAEVARLTLEGADGRRALAAERKAEAEARAAHTRVDELGAEVSALKTQLALARREAPAEAPRRAAPEEDALPSEEEGSEFLIPRFTREFYDSIDRWDRRMQRAAFDKAHLLALNWRHPSLRALALEGAEGYYRIRVATDVRLIYRRVGNALDILSLIDREDLDRYIKQAKTR